MIEPDHAHDLEALDRRGCSPHCFETTHPSDHGLEHTVICLDDVVQVFRGSMLGRGCHFALSFQATNGFRIRGKLVGSDRGRRPIFHDLQRLAEKLRGCLGIATV